MNFKIQVGTPLLKHSKKKEYSFDEAAQNIFLLHSENVIVYWNYICIPIDYKYVVGDILNDVLVMLESLLSMETGEKTIIFFENSFHTQWKLTWNEDELTIISEWYSVPNAEVMLSILQENNRIVISKTLFISEWKVLLRVMQDSLISYYTYAKSIYGFDTLILIEKKIKNKGYFYHKALNK